MELNLSENMKQLLSAFLLILLPILLLGIMAFSGVKSAPLYLIVIVWFSLGVIFFGTTD